MKLTLDPRGAHLPIWVDERSRTEHLRLLFQQSVAFETIPQWLRNENIKH